MIRQPYRRLWAAMSLIAVCGSVLAAEGVPLTTASSVRFATLEQGQALLAKPDGFLNSLSQFDCQARLQTDRIVTAGDVGTFAAAQVVAWTAEEQEALNAAISAVRERLLPFDLPFPASVVLVKTTGKEEGNAAYCRGPVIVLPTHLVRQRPAGLQRLLIHELFHVLSNHNPELRRALYGIVGFTTCEAVPIPTSLRDRKLTNPDAPRWDAYITLTVDDEQVHAVPILFASTDVYDVQRGGTFFKYLTFRLMAIESVADGWQPILRDGQPRLLDPKSIPSFHDQIGENTTYIIHPDEILADNFVHLVNQTKNLATPEIVTQMRQRLVRQRPAIKD